MELFALAGLVAGGVALAVFTAKSASAGDVKAQPSAGNPVKTTTSEVRKPVIFVRVDGCKLWYAKTVDGYDFYKLPSYPGELVNIQVLWWVMDDQEQDEYMRRNPSFVPDQSFEEEACELEVMLMSAGSARPAPRQADCSCKKKKKKSSAAPDRSGSILDDPAGFTVAMAAYSGGYSGDWGF